MSTITDEEATALEQILVEHEAEDGYYNGHPNEFAIRAERKGWRDTIRAMLERLY